MVHPSHRFWLRHRPTSSCRSRALALGLLVLYPTLALAQPPEPPTPRQRAELRLQKMREEMEQERRTRLQAPQPAQVQSRALSPDGKMALSYSSDGTLTLWEVGTGKEVRTIAAYDATPHLDTFSSATFSPDSKLLFTLGRVKQKLEPGAFGQIATVREGTTITETSQAKLWDVATGKLLWTLPEINDGVKWSTAINTFAFSADGKLLATKARYGPIHLWNTNTGTLVRTLMVPFINMDALAFSPDGTTLAGGGYHFPSYSGEVILWDVQSGELERSLKAPDTTVGTQIMTIAFSADGKKIATGGGAGSFERINDISGRFNPQYGVAQLWDHKSGILLMSLGQPVHRDLVTKLAFSPDGTRLATGSLDQVVGLWDTRNGQLCGSATRYGTEKEVTTTETKAGPQGMKRMETIEEGFGQNSKSSRTIALADATAPGTTTTARIKLDVTGRGVRDLVFSRDGQTLSILSDDKSVHTWDVSSPSPQSDPLRRVLPGSSSRYSSLAFSPDGRWLATGEHQNLVRFWRADNQQETQSFAAHNDAVLKVALAPLAPDEPNYGNKSPLLATASNVLQWKKEGEHGASGYTTSFEVKLWNSQNHEVLHTLRVPDVAVTALAVAPGGRWVAAAGGRVGPLPPGAVAGEGGFAVVAGGAEGDGTPADQKQEVTGVVLLWDATTGELKHKFAVVGDIPLDLAFSPDGKMLASDGGEAGVTFWQTADGRSIRTLDEDRPAPLQPGERRVTARFGTPDGNSTLAFTGDGARLVRSRKGVVKLWNVQTGELVSTLTDPQNTNREDAGLIALTPDGKLLATARPLQRLKLWDTVTGQLLWQSPEKSSVSLMAIAPNGRTLATSSGGAIRLWDLTRAAQGILK